MKTVVLGASGMLGNAMFRLLADSPGHTVLGTVRSAATARHFPEPLRDRLLANIDVLDQDCLAGLFRRERPDAVINCVGLIKQLGHANDPLQALPINAMLPHRLANLAALTGTRVVHMSTDCVFAGTRGGYTEDDPADALDLYGRSKHMGELADQRHCTTVRTSIIGHELASRNGLVDWFLGESGTVRGFRRAVFSGLPTTVLAEVIRDHVLADPDLHGLWQISAEPINKFDLLTLVQQRYGVDTQITPDDTLVIDRSLDSSRFRTRTGWHAPAWPELVARMHAARPDH